MKEEKGIVFLEKLALFALVLRACMAAAYYYFFVQDLKAPIYAFDGEAYSIIGWYIALVLKGVNMSMIPQVLVPTDYAVAGGFFGTVVNFGGHLPPLSMYGVGVYSYFIGAFYYVFGYAPVLLRIFTTVISISSAFIAYDIAKRVFGEKAGRITFVIMLFNPSFMLYSISLQRDTLVNFLILLVVSEALKIEKPWGGGRLLLPAALSAAGLVLLAYLRVNSMAVLALFVIILLYIKFAYAFKRLALLFTLGIFLIPPLYTKIFSVLYSKIILMLKYHWGLTYLGGYTFKLLPDSYYAAGDFGEGWFSQGVNGVDLICAIFRGLGAFIFEPSLFSMNKAVHLLALPQMLLWYLIVVFAAIGICDCVRHSNVIKMGLLAVLALFTLSIGISEANAETLIRHRDMIVPVYIIFAARGIEMISGSRDKKAL